MQYGVSRVGKGQRMERLTGSNCNAGHLGTGPMDSLSTTSNRPAKRSRGPIIWVIFPPTGPILNRQWTDDSTRDSGKRRAERSVRSASELGGWVNNSKREVSQLGLDVRGSKGGVFRRGRSGRFPLRVERRAVDGRGGSRLSGSVPAGLGIGSARGGG